jgi:hypothetical protein
MHVLPLAMQLATFARPKLTHDDGHDARFTLGLIGWSAVAKDPIWALDVIESLRRLDDR